MSEVMTLPVVNQDEFTQLEKDFFTKYQAACQTENAIFKAKVAASVAAHRLGIVAKRLQEMVEATEGKGSWGKYLQRHDMSPRTVHRAMRIAHWLDEATCANMTLTDADDLCAAKEAIERGNVKSVDEWRNLKKKLAEAREALEDQESQREKDLAEFEKKLDAKAQKDYAEEAKELDSLANRAAAIIENEAKLQAEKNAEALAAAEMAEALKDEGKASMPEPRAQGSTMPSEVAAELGESEEDEEDEEDEAEGSSSDLLDAGQIEAVSERLLEIVRTRPNDVTDAIEDPQVQAAVDNLVAACNDDPDVAFGVMAVWFSNNGL